ncbi:MAG TPA: hypothetical protein VKX46_16850, partial [Ktedonobacteraceae bacterium]|nr:hypothetical protein [Ktedonobacteraceae bacterium]
HYNVDGEYLDGPAPRSLDRFPLSFSGDTVVVDTSQLAPAVPRPSPSTRIIPLPPVGCAAV